MAEHAYSTPSRPPAPLTTRARLEAAVEAAIAALDALDGDPDLDHGCEDEGFDADSEPSLGRPEAHSQTSGLGPFSERHHRDGGIFEFGGATYDTEFA